MQYEYTLESAAPVRVTMTYAELKLIRMLIKKKATIKELDWRETDLLETVETVIYNAAKTMSNHYDYEVKYNTTKTEENDDA